MTCRAACLPEPDPAPHAITLPPGLPVGFGLCIRCHRLVAVEMWAGGEQCPGPIRVEEP